MGTEPVVSEAPSLTQEMSITAEGAVREGRIYVEMLQEGS